MRLQFRDAVEFFPFSDDMNFSDRSSDELSDGIDKFRVLSLPDYVHEFGGTQEIFFRQIMILFS